MLVSAILGRRLSRTVSTRRLTLSGAVCDSVMYVVKDEEGKLLIQHINKYEERTT